MTGSVDAQLGHQGTGLATALIEYAILAGAPLAEELPSTVALSETGFALKVAPFSWTDRRIR